MEVRGQNNNDEALSKDALVLILIVILSITFLVGGIKGNQNKENAGELQKETYLAVEK
ncbi:MAG: hypothetical protein ACRC2K_10230 [Clostridium sp.]